MIFYISDTHLGDMSVFNKCSRPFNNLDEMAETIIYKWNSKVKKDDTVYVLGDLAQDDYIGALNIFSILNGHKHLIVGNHDLKMLKQIEEAKVFESIDFMKLIEDGNRKVCLCHYPVMD